MVYPATSGPNAKPDAQPARYDFGMGSVAEQQLPRAESAYLQMLIDVSVSPAEVVHGWIADQLPAGTPKPALTRPVNWGKIMTYSTIGIASVIALSVLYPYLLPVLQNRNLWAALSVFTILLFCSGHMFNHIRGAPYMGGNGKGGVEYFAGGFQSQYGLESQIVGAMCMYSLGKLCFPSKQS